MEQEAPQAVPKSRSRALGVTSHVFYGLNVSGLVAMGILAIALRPLLRRIFQDFDVPLPALSRFFLDLSPIIYAVAIGGVIVFLTIKEFAIKNRLVTVLIEVAVALAALLFIGLYAVAMFIPMFALMKSLQPMP
ncbi:MAG: hypothetical protein V3U29_00910 [Phycisphaeraceae bacterium]